MPTYIRSDQAAINVSINGQPFGDTWKEIEGGALEISSSVKARPGAMGSEVAVGGLASRGDLTVRTNMTDVTTGWISQMEPLVGNGRVAVTLIWLGPSGAPLGGKTVRRGVLKTVTTPNMGSSSDVAMFEIMVDMDEDASS